MAEDVSREPIAVIVNKSNSLTGIHKSVLARMYSGKTLQWADGRQIVVINRPIDSEIRERFYETVLQTSPTTRFFLTGTPVPFTTRRLQSDAATCKMVARIPNAIGYVYMSAVDDTVKVLEIDGSLPDQETYILD